MLGPKGNRVGKRGPFAHASSRRTARPKDGAAFLLDGAEQGAQSASVGGCELMGRNAAAVRASDEHVSSGAWLRGSAGRLPRLAGRGQRRMPAIWRGASAAKSRERERPSAQKARLSGRIIIASMASGLLPPSRSSDRPPPKNMAKRAANMIAAAIVAATELMRMSRFFTWASSWAMTPASSSSVSSRMIPSVAATAACSGLRPVAKAFGEASGMM